MKLNARLKNLERTSKALMSDAHEDAGERIWAKLASMASRLEGTTPDEKWFKKASKMEIVAMAMLENSRGASTPLLWANVKDLAVSGPASIQKLFALLEAAHDAD